MTNRSATDKLIGYFYQFDRTILELLNLENNSDEITVEGFEDIDINGFSGGENIQVKYLTSQHFYNQDGSIAENSNIEKPILLLFLTFLETGNKQKLLGYFEGEGSDIITIDLEKLEGIISRRTSELNANQISKLTLITDVDKNNFIENFEIEIVDKDYDSQVEEVRIKLIEKFSLSGDEEIELYYNYGLSNIIQLTANLDENDRKITKGQFIEKIDKKENLFSFWFLNFKKETEYLKFIKKRFFTYSTIPNYERIIILEIKENDSVEKIKFVINKIIEKFNKVQRNTRKSPAPYIYIRNISEEKLLELKNNLWNESIFFEDGYYYKGGSIQINTFTRYLEHNSHIKIRIINDFDNINLIIGNITDRALELFDFYQKKPIEIETDKKISSIFIKNTENINNLL